jgi:hypothetical protein
MGRAGIFAKINKREHEPMSIPMSDEMCCDTQEGAILETRYFQKSDLEGKTGHHSRVSA